MIQKTPLGYKCIVNDKYEGLLYHNEIFEPLTLGEKRVAYVKTIRKDGHIDLNLRASGQKQATSAKNKLLQLLQQNKGSMPYNSKSDPELIKEVFGMSKKSLNALSRNSKRMVS